MPVYELSCDPHDSLSMEIIKSYAIRELVKFGYDFGTDGNRLTTERPIEPQIIRRLFNDSVCMKLVE